MPVAIVLRFDRVDRRELAPTGFVTCIAVFCRGRRPRRPASAHLRILAHSRLSLRRGGVLPRPPPIFCFLFFASGGDISRSGATPFCPRRQKGAKTPPKTHGLWNSFTPNVIRLKMAHKESPPRLSPLPLPRPALIVRCSKNSGPAGRTYTCRRWRQVRDLIIAKIGRTTRPHFALQER